MVRECSRKQLDTYLSHVRGVIHVGAHIGQERKRYHRHNLNVIWIEPNPNIFVQLQDNIQEFSKQKAYQYLITGSDGEAHKLNISSNNGASSSVLALGNEFHKSHPTIHYVDAISMRGDTLTTFLEKENINLDHYDALVIDTQGTELEVLKGAKDILSHFQYIRAESASYELYKKGGLQKDINALLKQHGFQETCRFIAKSKREFDIIYKKVV